MKSNGSLLLLWIGMQDLPYACIQIAFSETEMVTEESEGRELVTADFQKYFRLGRDSDAN